MMKTVVQYAKDMERLAESPDGLVRLKITLAGNLVSLYETEYKPVETLKAKFWAMKENYCNFKNGEVEVLGKREKPLSDTMVDSMWKLTDGGQKEIRLEITIKSYKLLVDAITTSVTWSQSAAKMQR